MYCCRLHCVIVAVSLLHRIWLGRRLLGTADTWAYKTAKGFLCLRLTLSSNNCFGWEALSDSVSVPHACAHTLRPAAVSISLLSSVVICGHHLGPLRLL